LALNRVLDSLLEIDRKPPLGSPPGIGSGPIEAPTTATGNNQRHQAVDEADAMPTTEFPIFMDRLEEFVKQLRSEGFDARTDLFNGQIGVIVGPKGLDPKRMPPDEVGFFLPLWELNYEGIRELVARREFNEIVENRPQGWLFNRPYQQGGTRPTNVGQGPHLLTLHGVMRAGDGSDLTKWTDTVQYEVRGLPPEQQAWIADMHDGWQILRVKNGVQGQWTGRYDSAEEALAVLQRNIDDKH
jgi:hypothetical protein